MKALFNQLFDYNFYCNKNLIVECKELKEVPKKTISLFSHVLNAHHIWNMRLLGKEWKYDVWEVHKLDVWEEIHYDNQRTTFEIITNNEDFEKRVDYKTTEGRVFASELKDILFHIINHSTHHRGQVLADFRANGITPADFDYITYKR
jgi:uncharacterized damage-inducible protein DinB